MPRAATRNRINQTVCGQDAAGPRRSGTCEKINDNDEGQRGRRTDQDVLAQSKGAQTADVKKGRDTARNSQRAIQMYEYILRERTQLGRVQTVSGETQEEITDHK